MCPDELFSTAMKKGKNHGLAGGRVLFLELFLTSSFYQLGHMATQARYSSIHPTGR